MPDPRPAPAADDLTIALAMSHAAAELALSHFHAGVVATSKHDGSPVTEADRAVEQLLREALAAHRPDDAILGEELGVTGSGRRLWILDPIDGTSCFARRDPNWRVHVALAVDERLEVAVVTAPALGIQWWARRGHGAYERPWPIDPVTPPETLSAPADRRLAVSTIGDLASATVAAIDERGRARLPRDATLRAPGPRGWCAELIELVRGEVEAFLAECCQVWDHAPWILVVEEAGGRFTARDGSDRGDVGGGLYSNAALHDTLRAALDYPTSPT